MSNLPKNLPALLRAAGLEVIEIGGWETRGRPASTGGFDPVGVLNHHTGSSAKTWSRQTRLKYADFLFKTGRSDLPAPLCQISLGPDGEVYVGAAGRANHAGTAKSSGSVGSGDGNTLYIGIEWMLSGTESIPAVMTEAGVTLNAVLTELVTGTSVETISCHYQTSVTGKWDIGDPNGISFNGKKVLDVDKFRSAVQQRRMDLYHDKTPTGPVVVGKGYTDVRVAHFSAETFDSAEMWAHDCEVVFSRKYVWITGTEGGEDMQWATLQAAAKKYGYVIRRYRSNWVAIKRSIIKPRSFKVYTETVIPTELVEGPGHDTAFIEVTFDHKDPDVGRITVTSSHYPTKGQPYGDDPERRRNLKWTTKIGRRLNQRIGRISRGKTISFIGADTNLSDKILSVFLVTGPGKERVLTCWDELGKYPPTGHGDSRDIIGRGKSDDRVKCLAARSYSDKTLYLYSDHFLVQANYRITHTK